LAERDPQQLADLALQVDLLPGQPRRLRGGGDLDVEAPVGPAALAGAVGGDELVDELAKPVEVFGGGAAGGQLGGGAGDRQLLVADLAQLVYADLAQQDAQTLDGAVDRSADEAAAAATASGLQQALLAQR